MLRGGKDRARTCPSSAVPIVIGIGVGKEKQAFETLSFK